MMLIQVCFCGKWRHAQLEQVFPDGITAIIDNQELIFLNGDWGLLW